MLLKKIVLCFFLLLVSSLVTAAFSQVKHPLRGLATMGSSGDLRKGQFNALKEARTHPGMYSGIVILTTWGQLEPERHNYDFSTIESALDDIRQYNMDYPETPVFGKLRIYPALNSPDWLLELAGGPVEIMDNSGNRSLVGLYWTAEYRSAWRELQQMLAKRYDDHPLIREVTVNTGAVHTAEPFISLLNKDSLTNLRAKGYNDAKFKMTLEGALEDYSPWKNTVIDFTFNMFRETDSGKQVQNIDFTLFLMREFRKKFGERAVIANHGLQPQLKAAALPIYREFSRLGGPIAAQTISPDTLTDESIQLGIDFGVTLLELWDSKEAGGHSDFNQNDLERWKEMINN